MVRLKELRIEQGKTQEEMARLLGISRQVYSNYENEINEPSLEMLTKMGNYFQCSVDFLIGRSDDFGNVTVKGKSGVELTMEEKALVDDFRLLARSEKTQASAYVHYLAETGKTKKNEKERRI
ncbi:MAG: helix-turn-helix transcriptional regulator [Clostridia bacterium]|nr:helix-turn-helix transcriptional regulator [Clostridia bacterium]